MIAYFGLGAAEISPPEKDPKKVAAGRRGGRASCAKRRGDRKWSQRMIRKRRPRPRGFRAFNAKRMLEESRPQPDIIVVAALVDMRALVADWLRAVDPAKVAIGVRVTTPEHIETVRRTKITGRYVISVAPASYRAPIMEARR